jgi:hypothetical protein
MGYLHHHPVSAVFSAVHAAFLAYGIVRFIGVKAALEDIELGLYERMRPPAQSAPEPTGEKAA